MVVYNILISLREILLSLSKICGRRNISLIGSTGYVGNEAVCSLTEGDSLYYCLSVNRSRKSKSYVNVCEERICGIEYVCINGGIVSNVRLVLVLCSVSKRCISHNEGHLILNVTVLNCSLRALEGDAAVKHTGVNLVIIVLSLEVLMIANVSGKLKYELFMIVHLKLECAVRNNGALGPGGL